MGTLYLHTLYVLRLAEHTCADMVFTQCLQYYRKYLLSQQSVTSWTFHANAIIRYSPSTALPCCNIDKMLLVAGFLGKLHTVDCIAVEPYREVEALYLIGSLSNFPHAYTNYHYT